ncbi:MAG: hypothetical protein FWG43_06255 [Clostridiales bacterium]|nr:hypothetical protein [Clostridiales bacterium]
MKNSRNVSKPVLFALATTLILLFMLPGLTAFAAADDLDNNAYKDAAFSNKLRDIESIAHYKEWQMDKANFAGKDHHNKADRHYSHNYDKENFLKSIDQLPAVITQLTCRQGFPTQTSN